MHYWSLTGNYKLQLCIRTTHWNVAGLVPHTGIHCITPESTVPVRIRVSTVVLCSCAAPIRKFVVRESKPWHMRRIRWPLLALLPSVRHIFLARVFTSCYRLSAFCTSRKYSLLLHARFLGLQNILHVLKHFIDSRPTYWVTPRLVSKLKLPKWVNERSRFWTAWRCGCMTNDMWCYINTSTFRPISPALTLLRLSQYALLLLFITRCHAQIVLCTPFVLQFNASRPIMHPNESDHVKREHIRTSTANCEP